MPSEFQFNIHQRCQKQFCQPHIVPVSPQPLNEIDLFLNEPLGILNMFLSLRQLLDLGWHFAPTALGASLIFKICLALLDSER